MKSWLTYLRYAGLWVAVLPLCRSQLLLTSLTGQHVVRQTAHLPHTETSLACFWALGGEESDKSQPWVKALPLRLFKLLSFSIQVNRFICLSLTVKILHLSPSHVLLLWWIIPKVMPLNVTKEPGKLHFLSCSASVGCQNIVGNFTFYYFWCCWDVWMMVDKHDCI